MRRVLQIMPEFGLAGAETMCENLVYQLDSSGEYDVYVASLYSFHSAITKRLEKNGIKVIYIGKKNGFDISTIGKLAKVMRQYKIDIIHTHRYVMQYAIPAAVIAHVPVRVHTVHNVATKEVDSMRRRMAIFFYKYCHVIPVSISPIVQKTVMREYRMISEQVPIVFNGVDLSKCMIKESYVASTPFRFIHIGRFTSQKNHGVIVESIAQIKKDGYNVHLVLLGSGEKENEYKSMVKAKGLDNEVTFCGLQGNIYPFMKMADCFILPSIYEGMPVTLIEAMGCGMPVIVSNVGGILDMVENESTGLIINPTVEELVASMKRMIDDEILREKLGKNALVKSIRFSAEGMCDGYINVYNKNFRK